MAREREETICEMEFELAMARLEGAAEAAERLGAFDVAREDIWALTMGAVRAWNRLKVARLAKEEFLTHVLPEIGR